MAELGITASFILSFEGGYVKSKYDRGGATNRGVTLATWRIAGYDKDGDGDIDEDDVKLISVDDAVNRVLRPYYWNKCGGDQICNQAIAIALVDWAWHSGVGTAVKAMQSLLHVKVDGVVGPKTIAAINSFFDQKQLFCALQNAREKFLERIIENNPSQVCFRKGWFRRVNSIKFDSITLNDGSIYAI